MEKKTYSKPFMSAQCFEPQEYVAACTTPNTWTATCDRHSSLIFYGDENAPYDLVCDLNRGGCGQSHTFTLTDGQLPKANCWILDGVSANTKYSDNNLAAYAYMFENISTPYSQYDGNVSGLRLKAEYQSKLIPAYVNTECVDGVLLTSDLPSIKSMS